MRQISQAAESFSVSTQTISQSAENLCTISEQLKQIQEDDSGKNDIDSNSTLENAQNSENEDSSFESNAQTSDASILVENSIFSGNQDMEV